MPAMAGDVAPVVLGCASPPPGRRSMSQKPTEGFWKARRSISKRALVNPSRGWYSLAQAPQRALFLGASPGLIVDVAPAAVRAPSLPDRCEATGSGGVSDSIDRSDFSRQSDGADPLLGATSYGTSAVSLRVFGASSGPGHEQDNRTCKAGDALRPVRRLVRLCHASSVARHVARHLARSAATCRRPSSAIDGQGARAS